MSYKVFALKWRPQTFDEVIGQDHIIKTLKNAILFDRVAHAYLFSGPRGIGKTSVARIFAKSLNCQKGSSIIPCNQCSNCIDITNGTSLDVIEIDGASNRRIDNIRELSENVKFSPANSKYKIYIIDEIHMLTKEAFNALLKTLEEPPSHIKFIFATTEPEKVIDTIISRCQRFDFRRIDISNIILNLKTLLKKEGKEIKENILYDIARAADGSMRDAESLLDQVISYCDSDMDKSDVNDVLGLIGFDSIEKLVGFIFKQDANNALLYIDNIVKQGKDVYILLLNLISYLRELIVMKVSNDKNSSLNSFTIEEAKNAENFLSEVSLEKLMYMINIFIELEIKLKKHNIARIPIEMAIVKLTHITDLVSLKNILDLLEKKEINQPIHEEELKKKLKETNDFKVNEGKVEDIWKQLMIDLKKENMPLSVKLVNAVPSHFDGKTFSISFSSQNKFYEENIKQDKNKNIIQSVLSKILNKEIILECVINTDLDIPLSQKKQDIIPKQSNAEIVSHPTVKKIISAFEGRVVDIIKL